jgi:hypothetical protein
MVELGYQIVVGKVLPEDVDNEYYCYLIAMQSVPANGLT